MSWPLWGYFRRRQARIGQSFLEKHPDGICTGESQSRHLEGHLLRVGVDAFEEVLLESDANKVSIPTDGKQGVPKRLNVNNITFEFDTR